MRNVLILCSVVAMFVVTQIHAQAKCAPHKAIDSTLAKKFGEYPRTIAMGNGNVVVQYANEDTGTWTLIVTTPDGRSCMIASGQAWTAIEAKPKGDAM